MLFLIKKIISSIITIPGILIAFLLLTGFYGLAKRGKALGINIIFGLIIYSVSISPVADLLIGWIEEPHIYRGKQKVNAIVLLGGGISEGVKDLSGLHSPSPDTMMRIVDAVRIYKRYRLPIIVSSGTVGNGPGEALIIKRFLIDLGVKKNRIITEKKSRDTVENARFVKKIFSKRGYKKGLLITSAYHMKRALVIFEGEGINVVPHSSGLLCEKKKHLNTLDFLPNIFDLKKSAIALKEAIGIAFYSIKYCVVMKNF